MVRIKVIKAEPNHQLVLKPVDKPYEPAFPKPGKRKKKTTRVKKPKVPEKVIQAEVNSYLRTIGVRPIRMPDELFRTIYANESVRIHIKTQIANHIAGLPDLIIPKITEKGTLILPLELKAIGGKLGPKQIKWQRELGTVVAHSTEEAIKLINDFLKGD